MKNTLIAMLFITLCICMIDLDEKQYIIKHHKCKNDNKIIYISTQDTALTKENVWNYILSKGIKYPKIVYNQSMLESANLTCTQCSLDDNNLFGFRNDSIYFKFPTWMSSIDYYHIWQYRRLREGEDYYNFLKRIKFAEDTNYTKRLKQFK